MTRKPNLALNAEISGDDVPALLLALINEDGAKSGPALACI
jgi:hypothetical protein